MNKKKNTKKIKYKNKKNIRKKTKKKKRVRPFKIIIILLIAFSLIGIGFGIYNSFFALRISDNVISQKEEIRSAMLKQDLDLKYLKVIIAQVQRESGGKDIIDIFQSSESKYGYTNGFTSKEESINQGIYYWNFLIKKCKELGLPVEIETILQAYNYGENYLDWLKKEGYNKWTLANSKEYQKKKNEKYGDSEYVPKIMKYLETEK